MDYEVLLFSSVNGIEELQRKMNKFFHEYSTSIDVIDISYHTEQYGIKTYGDEFRQSGNIEYEKVSALITVKNVRYVDLSEYR